MQPATVTRTAELRLSPVGATEGRNPQCAVPPRFWGGAYSGAVRESASNAETRPDVRTPQTVARRRVPAAAQTGGHVGAQGEPFPPDAWMFARVGMRHRHCALLQTVWRRSSPDLLLSEGALEPVLIFYFGLRAAPLGWGRRSCPWCTLSPISARSPGGRRSCLLCYEPRWGSNFRLRGPRSRDQTKTQTGSKA